MGPEGKRIGRASAAAVFAATLVTCTAQAAGRTTRIPCPETKPAFDYTAIDRDLTEPTYGGKPAYRFLACGPEGKQIVAVVADESNGAGTGVDTFYVDLDADGDITEQGEKFASRNAARFGKPKRGRKEGMVSVGYKRWGQIALPKTRLRISDDAFAYYLTIRGGFWRADCALKDGSWRTFTRFGDDMPWARDRKDAPVFRLGGAEWTMGNERFISRKRKRGDASTDVGSIVKPGMSFSVSGTTPFFAGSSPTPGRRWVAGGHKNLRSWIEFVDHADAPPIKLDFHEY